jgi:hypothetical protein
VLHLTLVPVLEIDRPCWLHVHANNQGMIEYRSPLVRDTAEMYRPVADLLAKVEHLRLLKEEIIHDVGMMYSRATYRVWSFVESLDQPENVEGLFFPPRELIHCG